MVRRLHVGEQIAVARENLDSGPVSGQVPQPPRRFGTFLTETAQPRPHHRTVERLPGHRHPVASGVQALERHLGWFIVAFHDGDAISVSAGPSAPARQRGLRHKNRHAGTRATAQRARPGLWGGGSHRRCG